MYLLLIRATFFCADVRSLVVSPLQQHEATEPTRRERGSRKRGRRTPSPSPPHEPAAKRSRKRYCLHYIASCLSACAILEIPCWSGTEGCLHHSLWFICDCCRFVFWAYECHEAGIQQCIIAHNGIVKSTQTTITLLGIWLFYGISDLPASMYMATQQDPGGYSTAS